MASWFIDVHSSYGARCINHIKNLLCHSMQMIVQRRVVGGRWFQPPREIFCRLPDIPSSTLAVDTIKKMVTGSSAQPPTSRFDPPIYWSYYPFELPRRHMFVGLTLSQSSLAMININIHQMESRAF